MVPPDQKDVEDWMYQRISWDFDGSNCIEYNRLDHVFGSTRILTLALSSLVTAKVASREGMFGKTHLAAVTETWDSVPMATGMYPDGILGIRLKGSSAKV